MLAFKGTVGVISTDFKGTVGVISTDFKGTVDVISTDFKGTVGIISTERFVCPINNGANKKFCTVKTRKLWNRKTTLRLKFLL